MSIRMLLFTLVLSMPAWVGAQTSSSLETLTQTMQSLAAKAHSIEPERRTELDGLAAWIAPREAADLVFICTHNSRRSHMAQAWASAGAAFHGVEGVRSWSGGTEATACNPRTVAALKRAGFAIAVQDAEAANPTYEVTFADGEEPLLCFSKVYSDGRNPQEGFAAVMTCSDADQGCPLVHGAAARFATPYVDPKVSDGTEQEAATYDERCLQIGTEMLYVMAKVARLRQAK